MTLQTLLLVYNQLLVSSDYHCIEEGVYIANSGVESHCIVALMLLKRLDAIPEKPI
jgi:hypothetical protein